MPSQTTKCSAYASLTKRSATLTCRMKTKKSGSRNGTPPTDGLPSPPTPSDAPDARPSRGVSALASLQYCHKKSTIGLNILKICLTEPKSRGVDLFPYARVIKLAAWTPQVFNLKNYFAAVANAHAASPRFFAATLKKELARQFKLSSQLFKLQSQQFLRPTKEKRTSPKGRPPSVNKQMTEV